MPRKRHSLLGGPKSSAVNDLTLYSYCLRYDDGAAPNPYWHVCTLAICKPAIRRVAKKGDWVVGIGSKNSPVGDISHKVVYAMEVTRVMTMKEYDAWCRRSLRCKIPHWQSTDFRRKMGDCIYDFTHRGLPGLRSSIHSEANRETDLGGLNVLLSRNFYYFGNRPVPLPRSLWPIAHATQGHKSHAIERFTFGFVEWLKRQGWKRNTLFGEPQLKNRILSTAEDDRRRARSRQDRRESERDVIC
jgi:hypothetical protein